MPHPSASIGFNSTGTLFVANVGNNTISEISSRGIVTAFATGLDFPMELAFNNSGILFVANGGGGAISEITPGGRVSTFASGLDPEALAFQPTTVPEPTEAAATAGLMALVAGWRRKWRLNAP